jgi:hypothetical protein
VRREREEHVRQADSWTELHTPTPTPPLAPAPAPPPPLSAPTAPATSAAAHVDTPPPTAAVTGAQDRPTDARPGSAAEANGGSGGGATGGPATLSSPSTGGPGPGRSRGGGGGEDEGDDEAGVRGAYATAVFRLYARLARGDAKVVASVLFGKFGGTATGRERLLLHVQKVRHCPWARLGDGAADRQDREDLDAIVRALEDRCGPRSSARVGACSE